MNLLDCGVTIKETVFLYEFCKHKDIAVAKNFLNSLSRLKDLKLN